MFMDRQDAARQLAKRLSARTLQAPVVLGIPRGGLVIGAVLARALGGELDVVLARKLRAPWQPELAIGAIGEDGEIILSDFFAEVPGATTAYLETEKAHQAAEIERRKQLFRAIRPAAEVAGRTVIVTDDGIATGATMFAALHVIRARKPQELIVAVPVAPPDILVKLRSLCDRVECLVVPAHLGAIGAFYQDFTQVKDDEALALLREACPKAAADAP